MSSCQQDNVYTAESGMDEGRVFESLHEAQQWVDALRETHWWEGWLSEILRVEVGPARKGAKFAGVGWYEPEKRSGRMEFSTCRPTERLLVHELAHVVASARRNSKSHDPWFARIYYELTYLIMGPQQAFDLALRFVSHDVDYDAGGITEWTRSI